MQEDIVLEGEYLIADEGNCGAKYHGKGNAAKIHEAAVAEYAAVCVEYPEGDGERDKQDAKIPEDGPEVLCDLVPSIKEIVSEIAAEDDDEIVYNQDTPVGQGVAGEIPIDETRNDIHDLCGMSIWAKVTLFP